MATTDTLKLDLAGTTIMVTGVCGFIGSYVAAALQTQYPTSQIIGIDNLDPYYDVNLKQARLKKLQKTTNFTFYRADITDQAALTQIFKRHRPAVVFHFAAQAGVRYSIDHPDVYIQTNIIGFFNILEACRHYPVQHLIYASSSSVYGDNQQIPYCTTDKVADPASLYAATKASNELLATTYAKLYAIPATGLRFFTVYGPAGRPDMAYFKFTARLLSGQNIALYNYGRCQRDFTYIDDVVACVLAVATLPPRGHRLLNVGKGHPDGLRDLIQTLGACLKQAGLLAADYDLDAHLTLLPPQPGDVTTTWANIDDLKKLIGFAPQTDLRTGLAKFVAWYAENYQK